MPALLLLFLAFLTAAVIPQKANDGALQRVRRLTAGPTSFPDHLYGLHDWSSFVKSGLPDRPIDPSSVDIGLLNASVFYRTNEYRESIKRKPLKFSPGLRDAATYHSLEIVRAGFFDHENPGDEIMKDPWKRAKHFNVIASRVGENIAKGFMLRYEAGSYFWQRRSGERIEYFYGSPLKPGPRIEAETYSGLAEAVMEQWIESPMHRSNLQAYDFSMLGCGAAAEHSDSTTPDVPTVVCTQNFAVP